MEVVLFQKNHSESDSVIWYLSSVSRLLNFVAIVTTLTKVKATVFTKGESHEEIDRIKLYPYLKYDISKNMFECAFCPQMSSGRQHLLKHLNRFHVSEIKSEIEENGVRNTEPKYDCIIR